jgi:RsmE family RNA methyltransferase
VGPEGGFDGREREQARAAGAMAVNLGPWTLRAETVAPAGLALLQYAYGTGAPP